MSVPSRPTAETETGATQIGLDLWPYPAFRYRGGHLLEWNPAAERLLRSAQAGFLERIDELAFARLLPWLSPAARELESDVDSSRGTVRQMLGPCGCGEVTASLQRVYHREHPEVLVVIDRLPSDVPAQVAENTTKIAHPDDFIDSLPDAVCIVNPETFTIERANRQFSEEYAQGADAVGQTCFNLAHGLTSPCNFVEQRCILNEVRHSGKKVTLEHIFRDAQGREKLVEVCAAPLQPGEDSRGRVLYMLRDIGSRSTMEQLHRLRNFDKLTGLPNRLLFHERLRQDLEQATQKQGMVAVVYLDLDRFKGINDSFGHGTGDQVLQEVAQRISGCLRRHDLVARIGGDEFVVILTALSSESQVEQVAERIIELIGRPFEVAGQELGCSASCGIALFPVDGQDGDDLLKNAEFAMYQAKEQEGRNACRRFSPESCANAVEQLMLETGLRHAIEAKELFLHFQPQVDCATRAVVGAEALLRWQHPYIGVIPPLKFIPLAEETGLILPIGEWVLAEACARSVAWRRLGLPKVRIAINLSARQFREPDLVERVGGIIASSGIDPELVELELTESLLLNNVEATIRTLHQFKDLGVCLAIDDFGTGYSSLSYLRHFPVDRVKIDRAFVKEIGTGRDDGTLAAAIIAMAQALKLKVIAEGVEDQQQFEFLRERGCDEIQGYYFGRPVAEEALVQLLEHEAADNRHRSAGLASPAG